MDANKTNKTNNNFSRRARVVFGKSSETKFKGVPLPGRDFFVSRVDARTESSDINSFLSDHGINVRDITIMSHPDSKFKSFKIVVSVNDTRLFLQDDIWPDGVKVQRFYNRKTSNNQTNT